MSIYEIKKPKRINSVSVTFFFVALVVAYTCWAIIPMFWPVFQLTGIMRGACNDAYRTSDNEVIIKKLIKDSSRTGLRLSPNNFRMSREPYSKEELKGKSEDTKIRFQKRGKVCVIEMHYEDDFTLPLLNKTVHVPFDRTVTAPLELVDYGPGCSCIRLDSEER